MWSPLESTEQEEARAIGAPGLSCLPFRVAGFFAAGRRHNIWRYSLACVPSLVPGSAHTAGSGFTVRNASTIGDGGRAPPSSTDLNGGSLDLTVRAFETRELEKPPHEYAHLVVRDISISEVRLVTTRSIDGLTSEVSGQNGEFGDAHEVSHSCWLQLHYFSLLRNSSVGAIRSHLVQCVPGCVRKANQEQTGVRIFVDSKDRRTEK